MARGWVFRPNDIPPKLQKQAVQLPARAASEPTRYLSVVAIVKNEGRYLREWIEFQRLMGVEQVYLYDNGSTDNSAEVLAPFVAEQFATVIPWATFDEQISPQRQAYAHALINFGPHSRWMAFIDLDEFLFPVKAADLVSVLRTYEDCTSLCVPWFMFGFSGHDTPPPGLVIENYTERAPFPPQPPREKLLKWKSIVNPAEVTKIGSLHMFEFTSGDIGGVDERRLPVTPEGVGSIPPISEVLRINHYFTRSRQEFQEKSNSVRFTTGATTHEAHPDPSRRHHMANKIEAETVADHTIQRFIPALRKQLTQTRSPKPATHAT